MLNQLEIIKHIKNNSFEIFCPSIHIVDNKGAKVIGGSGIIKQNDKGKFYYNIFVEEDKQDKTGINTMSVIEMNQNKDFYNDFTAYDVNNNLWKFNADANAKFGVKNSLIYGSFKKIETEIDSQSNHKNRIDYFFNINIPIPYHDQNHITTFVNDEKSDVSTEPMIKVDSDLFKIRGKKHENYHSITFLKVNGIFNPEVRLLEGLRFITGCRIEPYIIDKHLNGCIYRTISTNSLIKPSAVKPPLEIDVFVRPFAINSWNLFIKYINAVKNNTEKYFSPMGTLINAITGLGAIYLESHILILCVTIEALISKYLPNIIKLTKAEEEELNTVIQHVKESDYSLKDRLIGSISNIRNPRMSEVMNHLKNLNVINNKLKNTWLKNRPKVVHNFFTVSGSSNKFISGLDIFDSLLEMFYRIIFYLIDYSGLYTEYSKTAENKMFKVSNNN